MYKIVVSERTKDWTLNTILVLSILLFIFGWMRPNVSNRTGTPASTNYSAVQLAPLNINEPTVYEPAETIDLTSSSVVTSPNRSSSVTNQPVSSSKTVNMLLPSKFNQLTNVTKQLTNQLK